MKAIGISLIFLFPYSQLVLIALGYIFNLIGNWQRAKSDMAQMKWRPFWKARFDWKVSDAFAVVFYFIALVTAIMYLFIMFTMKG